MSAAPDKYYISDDIFYDFELASFYKETEGDDDTIIKKITNSNFKEEFRDYGWGDLDFLWNIELGDKFMLLDCGSHGDCLFHSIAEALNLCNICSNNPNISDLYDVESLRKKASEEILESNFDFILQNYKIEKTENEFQGDWNPDEIETKEQLRNEMCKTGNNFWGDHIIIQLLSQSLKKNIIVLNGDEDFEKLSFNRIETKGAKKYIIIYFENNCHFKLVGKFNGKKITTVFNQIPKNLLNLEN